MSVEKGMVERFKAFNYGVEDRGFESLLGQSVVSVC